MPPLQRPHSLSMGKMRLPIPGKSRGDICADVAVARPSRCWTGYVQIVSDQQKTQSGSHVCASSATHQRHGLRAGRDGHSEHACMWVPGPQPPPLREHQSPPSNSLPGGKGVGHAWPHSFQGPVGFRGLCDPVGPWVGLPAGPGLGGWNPCLLQTV